MGWHRRPKRMVYTLDIGNYCPDITAITYPLLKYWAEKARAEFVVLTERRFPHWPPNMEKFQVFERAQADRAEEIILMDADALCHPDNFWPFDVAPYSDRRTVFHNGADMAYLRWVGNKYLWRDGRNLGSGTWMVGCTDWTIDLFRPPDADMPSIEEATASIYPVVQERTTVIDRAHLLDDYYFSLNIARFGLKFKGLMDVVKELNLPGYWDHQYTISKAEKVVRMKAVMQGWGIL